MKAPFKRGELVTYPARGLMKIVDVTTEEIAGHKLTMFVLKQVYGDLTILVPCDKATERGLRKLEGPEVIKQIVATLKEKKGSRPKLWSQKILKMQEDLQSTDINRVASVIRDLHNKEKEISYSALTMYEEAMSLLLPIVAITKKISISEALDFLCKETGLQLAFDPNRLTNTFQTKEKEA